jgi:cyclophilin family peptidyl-prolyl cis-trans isomerase
MNPKNKLHNTRGTLAMARTSDPDSAAAQFFH